MPRTIHVKRAVDMLLSIDNTDLSDPEQLAEWLDILEKLDQKQVAELVEEGVGVLPQVKVKQMLSSAVSRAIEDAHDEIVQKAARRSILAKVFGGLGEVFAYIKPSHIASLISLLRRLI